MVTLKKPCEAGTMSEDADALSLRRDSGLSAADAAAFCEDRLRAFFSLMDDRTLLDSGFDPEAFRRSLASGKPLTLEAVLELTARAGLSAEWVLFGSGPVHLADVPRAVLRAQPPQALLACVSEALEGLA